jgi:hypothetical protein
MRKIGNNTNIQIIKFITVITVKIFPSLISIIIFFNWNFNLSLYCLIILTIKEILTYYNYLSIYQYSIHRNSKKNHQIKLVYVSNTKLDNYINITF